jgi:hypothetical protein
LGSRTDGSLRVVKALTSTELRLGGRGGAGVRLE